MTEHGLKLALVYYSYCSVIVAMLSEHSVLTVAACHCCGFCIICTVIYACLSVAESWLG